jgi:hypothetical protein
MDLGQQKSQFRISMQTPVENPLTTVEKLKLFPSNFTLSFMNKKEINSKPHL